MKQTILTIALIAVTALAKAQSGLEFSQVKFLNLTYSAAGTANLGTVPAGKVWKLENVQYTNSNGTSLASCTFRYNGSSTGVPVPYVYNASSILGFMSNNNPIWWPAGTVLDINTTANGNTTIYFSILEFNVVP